MLIKYVREERKITKKMGGIHREYSPIGVVVADIIDGQVKIGWSKCMRKDHFNKRLGKQIAQERMLKCHKEPPREIIPYIAKMKERASKYFGGKNVQNH
jgi:hypothetical protein